MGREDFHGISEQRKAAMKRLRDARFLLAEEDSARWRQAKGHHARGAMYLAGYSIECKLKAIAMEVQRCRTLKDLAKKWESLDFDVYTHGLEALAKRLPLYDALRRSAVWKDFASQVNRWRPSWRYDPEDHSNDAAAEFMRAIVAVYTWLSSNH